MQIVHSELVAQRFRGVDRFLSGSHRSQELPGDQLPVWQGTDGIGVDQFLEQVVRGAWFGAGGRIPDASGPRAGSTWRPGRRPGAGPGREVPEGRLVQ